MDGWTTRDYFDPFPGMAAGLAKRRQREAERAQGVQEKQAASDAAMREADTLMRAGVPPVLGDDGAIDWRATANASRMKAELTKQAQALATIHAWEGGPQQLTEEEALLTKTPEYQQAYRAVSAIKAQKDAEQFAEMEQIRARGAAALDVARQRGENANTPQATLTRKLPDGSTIRIPMDPSKAMDMGGESGSPTQDKWQSAIDSIIRFRDAGTPIDVGIDDEGFPKITKSKSWGSWSHDASPGKAKSYDKLIEDIMKRSGKTAAPRNVGGRSPIVIPR